MVARELLTREMVREKRNNHLFAISTLLPIKPKIMQRFSIYSIFFGITLLVVFAVALPTRIRHAALVAATRFELPFVYYQLAEGVFSVLNFKTSLEEPLFNVVSLHS